MFAGQGRGRTPWGGPCTFYSIHYALAKMSDNIAGPFSIVNGFST